MGAGVKVELALFCVQENKALWRFSETLWSGVMSLKQVCTPIMWEPIDVFSQHKSVSVTDHVFLQSIPLWQKLQKSSVSICSWLLKAARKPRLAARQCGRTDPCTGTLGPKSIMVSYHLSDCNKLTDYLIGCLYREWRGGGEEAKRKKGWDQMIKKA